MNKAAFLLFVATLAPNVSPATFRLGSHLAFVVRGGADEVHSEVAGIVDKEKVEILDEDIKEKQTDQLEGECGASGVEKSEGCAVDTCSVRGGSDVPESIDLVDENEVPAREQEDREGVEQVQNDDPSAVRGGADVPETTDIDDAVEETADNSDDKEGGEGEEGATTNDPTDVRGGADVPEAEDVDESNDDGETGGGGEEVLADDPSAVRGGADVPETTDIEAAEETAEKSDGDEGSVGEEGDTLDDQTGVRGGADVPEVADVSETAEEVGESKNDDEEDDEGGDDVHADDPSAVRGGADVPETPEIDEVQEDTNDGNHDGDDGEEGDGSTADDATADDATAVRGGADVPAENDPSSIINEDETFTDANGVEEIAENEDGVDDGEGGEEATAEDPTSTRGGAYVPESIDHAGVVELPDADDGAVEVDVDRKVNDDDNRAEDETPATSVRGGAQNAADSKDLLDEAEYDYDDEELDEGQFEPDDDFYEDEDELSVADASEIIDASEIEDDVETPLDDSVEADGFQVEEPALHTIDETVTLYETVAHQHAMDDDSSAFVDREELADAYDDDETSVGATSFRAGHTDDADRASIDDVPRTDEFAGLQDYESAQPEPGLDANADELSVALEGETSVDANNAVISKEVEQILVKECGFRKSELRGMKPQIANVVAEKRLRRPLEGIPDSWYDEKRKGLAFATLTKVLAVAIPIALGALAIFGGEHFLMLLERRGKSELLIGVEVEKPRKDEGELTIPGTEVEEESFEDDTLETSSPAPSSGNNRFKRSGNPGEGNWLKTKISAIENSLKRKANQ